MRTLFGADQRGQTLAEYCEKHMAAMEREVQAWNSDELLRTPDQEVVDYLVKQYSVSCPVLRTQERHRDAPVRADLPARPPVPGMEFARGGYGQSTVPGTKMTFIVPFDGDTELFSRRQNPFTRVASTMPEVKIQTGEVRIHWAQPDHDPADADQINAFVNQQISALQLYLDRTATQAEQFNGELARRAAQLVAAAKARVTYERNVTDRLDFPLKRRRDADQYLVPLTGGPWRCVGNQPQPHSSPSMAWPTRRSRTYCRSSSTHAMPLVIID